MTKGRDEDLMVPLFDVAQMEAEAAREAALADVPGWWAGRVWCWERAECEAMRARGQTLPNCLFIDRIWDADDGQSAPV